MILNQLFECITIKLKKYKSTRGDSTELLFKDVVLSGVAKDGGLYVPSSDTIDLSSVKSDDYESLVRNVFIATDDSSAELLESFPLYKGFSNEPTPKLKELEEDFYLMELFHNEKLNINFKYIPYSGKFKWKGELICNCCTE